MGQKVNPISLRLEHTNRRFESCWYGDYQYSYLLSEDLKVKSYINSILKQLGCPESHISLIYMAKKIKILFCYLDPRRSTYKKSRRLYIKMVNKDPIEMLYEKQRPYFISRFIGRYLHKRLNNIGSNAPKQGGVKHNQKLPSVMKKKGVVLFSSKKKARHLIDTKPTNQRDIQIYNQEQNASLRYSIIEDGKELNWLKKGSPKDLVSKSQNISPHQKKKRKPDPFLSTPISASLNVINKNPNKETRENSKTFLSDATRAQRVGSVIHQKGERTLKDASLQTIKSKKKETESNHVNATREYIPYSPLENRRNPFKLLDPKKEKKKKKEKYFTKRALFDPSSKAYKNWWKAWRRRRKLKGKKNKQY